MPSLAPIHRHDLEAPIDRAEFRMPAHRPGVELFQARIVHHAFEPHTHQAFGFGVIEEGVERFRYRGADHLAAPGSIVLMNPDALHTGQAECPEGWGYRMLYLDPDALTEIAGESGWWFDRAVVDGDPKRSRALSALLGALWQSDDALEMDGLLVQLVAALRPYARGAGSGTESAAGRFDRVLDCMHAALAEPWGLDDLAAVAGLSRFHFLRQFQAQYHVTPHKMLMALRLHAAKRWLAQGVPAAEVAAMAGLADQAHLSRAFVQRYGVSPARYQRQVGRSCGTTRRRTDF